MVESWNLLTICVNNCDSVGFKRLYIIVCLFKNVKIFYFSKQFTFFVLICITSIVITGVL